MRLSSPRFTIRRLMVVVVVVALTSLVASNPYRHDGIRDNRIVIPVASIIAVAYGLGAMRRPKMFLVPLIAAWIATPTVFDRSPDLIDACAMGCYLGWIIGVPAGWLSGFFGKLDTRNSVAPDPPEPK